jgi:hypothetical protein
MLGKEMLTAPKALARNKEKTKKIPSKRSIKTRRLPCLHFEGILPHFRYKNPLVCRPRGFIKT